MKPQMTFLFALFLACATPKKEPTQDTKTPDTSTLTNLDSKPTTDTPMTSTPWPPAGYKFIPKPIGSPVRSIPGWVELPSLSKHKAMEAVAPQRPLLNGAFDDEGMFYTDGKVEGGTPTKECAPGKETYLNITKMTSSPTLPVAAPDTILLYLCEGKHQIIGKEELLVPNSGK
jgi:hypothetical protein